MKISQHTDNYTAKMLHFDAYKITMCIKLGQYCQYLFFFHLGHFSVCIFLCLNIHVPLV